jgi:hypothetical protein
MEADIFAHKTSRPQRLWVLCVRPPIQQRGARIRADEPHQNPQARGLVGAVGAEQTGDLTRLSGQVEMLQPANRRASLASPLIWSPIKNVRL